MDRYRKTDNAVTRQPVQVSGVPVVDSARELDLNGHDLAVVADEDQVNLVIALAECAAGSARRGRRY
jgi:hypothetical protein